VAVTEHQAAVLVLVQVAAAAAVYFKVIWLLALLCLP
jgi:hypothetical protein